MKSKHFDVSVRLNVLIVFAIFGAACTGPPLTTVLVDLAYPNVEGSGEPHLAVAPTGEVILSWLEPTPQGHSLKFAAFSGEVWSTANTVETGADLMANWADFPSVVPISGDLWAAHWLVFQADNPFGYDAMASLSRDAGKHWGAPFLLHRDMTPTEHGFVSFLPRGSGLGVVWLDGRNMIVNGEPAFVGAGGKPLGMSLRYAQFSAGGDRQFSGVVDDLVCDCCQTDVAVTGNSLVLAYRDRTADDIRDIVVRRLEDGKWTARVQVGPDGWFFPGCPINGPAIAADGEEVVVAWFAAPNDDPKVRLARSSNGGRTFLDPVSVDTAGSFGHVDVALLKDGDAAVSWVRRDGQSRVALSVRLISVDGVLGDIYTVSTLNTARPLDFPQMVSNGRSLIFAWTGVDVAEGIKTARLELAR